MADSSALRERIMEGAARAVDRAAEAVAADLWDAAPYRTGATKFGIQTETGIGDPLHPAATVRSTTPQGDWVNDGTPPHPIYPVLAKALRFEAGGGIVFAKKVQHPGITATHWFDDAVAKFPQRLAEQFPAAWDG